MIVFKYEHTGSVESCHFMLDKMELPGEKTEEELNDEGATLVFKGDRFLAIHYADEGKMELYATKNTNSVNYFIMKYKFLDWDTYSVIKSKRWGGKK